MKPNLTLEESTEPSYQDIEKLLRRIQPVPSPRFYHIMEKAPWKKQPVTTIRLSWVYAMLLLSSLVVASFLMVSPLRAIAKNWLSFFLPDQQDKMEISLDYQNIDELFQDASPSHFPYTIEQVSQYARYQIKLLTNLSPGMDLVGARYEPETHMIVLLYHGAGYNLFLSQRPIDTGQEYFSIGASAVVEEVSIGSVRGEYVEGGWIGLAEHQNSDENTSNDLEVQWDASLPQYTLRWQDQGFMFQLRSTGNSGPQKDDLISLAQTIN